VWAAKQARVGHVVRMSAVGAAHDAPTVNSRLHALSDAELAASGIPFTILKPHFFLQALLWSAGTVIEEGAMYWAFGDAKMPAIDVADIGDVAAKILSDPAPHAGKTYTLTGAVALSLNQMAAAIGEAIGKPVRYVPVPVSAAVEGVAKMGMDDYWQVAMRDYLTAYSRGWQSAPTDTVVRITGKEPRTIGDFARRYASAFRKK
jgi:uncharacterized protein YbjT (DUF2867 family)